MSSLDTNVIEHSHGSEARTEALQEENGSVFLAQQRQGPGGQEQQFTGREPKSHRLSSLHDRSCPSACLHKDASIQDNLFYSYRLEKAGVIFFCLLYK